MKNPTTALTAAVVLLAALAALGGCDSTPLAGERAAPVETRSPVATPGARGGAAATTTPAPQSSVATVDLATSRSAGAEPAAAAAAGTAAMAMAMPAQNVLYFDFDSYAIKDSYQPLLDGYAKALAANRAKRLVIEGHTDERGGHEYNLALGQKRAEAVLRSLALLGASDGQLEAVSFGEERPAVQGNDESAWSKNRRAELKDR